MPEGAANLFVNGDPIAAAEGHLFRSPQDITDGSEIRWSLDADYSGPERRKSFRKINQRISR